MGIDARAARVTWTIFLICLLLAAVYAARHTILLFVLALFFAYMLSPLVERLHKYAPRRISKTFSLAVIYVLFLTFVIAGVMQIGGQVSEQARSLSVSLPNLLKQQGNPAIQFLPVWLQPYMGDIVARVREQLGAAAENALPVLHSASQQLATIAGSIGVLVLVPILGFFFLKDGDDIQRSLIQLFPEGSLRLLALGIMDDLHFVISKYIRALVILSLAVMISYLIFFEITGVPYALLLAVIAGPLEFIPVLGWLGGGLAVLVVSGFSGYPHLLWIVAFILIYRVFQDYVLSPYLMSEGVEVHPLLIIFGVLAGEQIGGIWGMFLSVPVLAVLRVIYTRLRPK